MSIFVEFYEQSKVLRCVVYMTGVVYIVTLFGTFLFCLFVLNLIIGHGLYEITRNEEFVSDMTRIFDLSQDKFQQLLFNVNSGATSELKTAQLLFAYSDELDLFRMDKSGMAPIHYACQKGLSKTLKLFLANVSNDSERLKKLINLKANATVTISCLVITIVFVVGLLCSFVKTCVVVFCCCCCLIVVWIHTIIVCLS